MCVYYILFDIYIYIIYVIGWIYNMSMYVSCIRR